MTTLLLERFVVEANYPMQSVLLQVIAGHLEVLVSVKDLLQYILNIMQSSACKQQVDVETCKISLLP